jgi:hypothetical protein
MKTITFELGPLADEMGSANFGDERLSRRLSSVVDAVSKKPSDGFPKIFGND